MIIQILNQPGDGLTIVVVGGGLDGRNGVRRRVAARAI